MDRDGAPGIDRKQIEKLIRRKPTRLRTEINILFLTLVVGAFLIPIFVEHMTVRLICIETGILLLSLKFAYFLRNEAKVNHFEFWTLASIEWRLNEIQKELREQNRLLSELLKRTGAKDDEEELQPTRSNDNPTPS